MIRFTKMHGLGNDFAVIDAINQAVDLDPARVRALADRHTGIGFDQMLLVEKSNAATADFRYRIFNADGGEVEQCGNGARCFLRFLHEQGLTGKARITVETAGGPLQLRLEKDGQVTVDMGKPRLEPADIPFEAPQRAVTYPLDVNGETISIAALSMGNPHAVLQVDDVAHAPVARLGAAIEAHPRFPARVNAGFMQVLDRKRIRLRVYERGAGETLACGSGACAAVVAGRLQGLLDETAKVILNGGELVVSWAGEGQPVLMTGPATTVYQGQIEP